jgi:hypothetical protein
VAVKAPGKPPDFSDAINRINLNSRPDRWLAVQAEFERVEIAEDGETESFPS